MSPDKTLVSVYMSAFASIILIFLKEQAQNWTQLCIYDIFCRWRTFISIQFYFVFSIISILSISFWNPLLLFKVFKPLKPYHFMLCANLRNIPSISISMKILNTDQNFPFSRRLITCSILMWNCCQLCTLWKVMPFDPCT